jgi:hypothetical protein
MRRMLLVSMLILLSMVDIHKTQVYNVPLQGSDMYLAYTFNFLVDEERGILKLPRKVLLSPNKELLLLFGVMYRGQDCLVVYVKLHFSNEVPALDF